MKAKVKKRRSSRFLIENKKIKKNLRKNNFWAVFLMLLSVFMFLLAVAVTAILIKAVFGSVPQIETAVEDAIQQAELDIALSWIILWFAAIMGIYVVEFFLCLALRRGNEERVKGGWLALYIILSLAVIGGFIGYTAMTIGFGDLAVIIYCGELAFLWLYGLITICLGHSLWLLEGKTDALRNRENGKLHGGVWLMYLTRLSLFGIICLLMAGRSKTKYRSESNEAVTVY